MSYLRFIKSFCIALLAALLFTACGPSDEESIAVSVALTQTAAAQATVAAAAAQPEATEAPQEIFPGELQPLGIAECADLAAAMGQELSVQIEQINVAVEHEGKTGGGCQAIAMGTGLDFSDMMSVEEAMRGMLFLRGWLEDPSAPACLGTGGWGPGASASCYNQADSLCEVFVHIDPIDASLCTDDEPITVCFDRLTAEQIVYTINLTCAGDASAGAEPLESELMRIVFAPGEIRAWEHGEVLAGGFDHYVLGAIADQEMTVNLLDAGGAVMASDAVALVIWGADGTVLISSHADALGWSGTLPFTQDYYIDVKSISAYSVAYTLEVIIPPVTASAGSVFPEAEPFPFGEMQTIVFTGVPPMLPPKFPVEEGLLEVAAFMLTMDEGEYELSLDYGVDCQGAGACHYGSMAGMMVNSWVPVGTSSFSFVLEEAQVVDLSYGITGYFVPAACAANCDDARLWWIYEGYEYMLGLNAGVMEDVISLANAAIVNSVQ
ncbi:MAG: hypothetical protein MUP44_11215 [Anaerolineales bacterium]|nr:hypothetical protein [Anaerolineales bacterium]